MKKRLTIIFIIGFVLISTPAHSREDYFIEDEWVLLYKVINWWYTCLEADAQWLCGKSIRFEIHGGIQSTAHDQDNKVVLTLAGDYADQLSLFTETEKRNHFKLVRQTPGYFPENIILPPELYRLDRLSLSGISGDDRTRIRLLIPLLNIQIQGRIRGLVNNRIALHPVDSATENQIRFCPEPEDSAPIFFSIIHRPTGKELVRYKMAWD